MSVLDRPVVHSSVPGRTPVRWGPVSGVWRPRVVLISLGLAVLALLLLAAGTGRGDYPISISDVLAVLAGGGDPTQRLVVIELRLPRALTGLLVGLALGTAGAITQSVARNPLASPDVLGITAGASAAAVAVIVLGGGAAGGLLGYLGLPLAALLGGLLTALLVYALAWRQGIDGFRLVLVGIGIGSILSSITTYLLIKAEITQATQATVWLTGSLNGRGWQHVVPVGLAVLVFGAVAVSLAPALAALRLSEDTARSLGLRLQLSTGLLVLAAVALAAVATSAAGPVLFVAFVSPQIAMRLVRSAGPPMIAGGLVGAVMLLGSDLIARTVLPVELPVGIVTAAIGAPYLIHLLVQRNRKVSA